MITIETWQRTTIQKRSQKIYATCERCRTETQKFAPDRVAEIFGTTTHTVYRLVEDGVFHFTEANALLVCGNSIQRCLEARF